jgi:hypothetical protein
MPWSWGKRTHAHSGAAAKSPPQRPLPLSPSCPWSPNAAGVAHTMLLSDTNATKPEGGNPISPGPAELAGEAIFAPHKSKASNSQLPLPRPWSGRPRRLQRETAIGAQSLPPSNLLRESCSTRVTIGRVSLMKRAGLSVSSGMPWQSCPVLELQTGEGETVRQHRVAFPSFHPPICFPRKSGQLAMIHPQPPWSLSLSSTDRHACRPLAVSWRAWVGNRQSCPERTSTDIGVCILAVSGHRLHPPNPASGFGDLG